MEGLAEKILLELQSLNIKIDRIEKEQKEFRAETQARFEAIDKKFEEVDKRLDTLESKMSALENRMDNLEKKVDIIMEQVASNTEQINTIAAKIREHDVDIKIIKNAFCNIA